MDFGGETKFREGCDKWMTCDFKSFSTVFPTYQDNDRVIMIDLDRCLRVKSFLLPVGIQLGTTTSAGQHIANGAPNSLHE